MSLRTHQYRPATTARLIAILAVLVTSFAVVAPSGADAASTKYKSAYLYTLDGLKQPPVVNVSTTPLAASRFNTEGTSWVRYAKVTARVSGGKLVVRKKSIKSVAPRQYKRVANPSLQVSYTGNGSLKLSSARSGQFTTGGADSWLTQVGLGSFLKKVAKKALGITKDCALGAVGTSGPQFVTFVLGTANTVPQGRVATAVGGCLTGIVIGLVP